VKQRMNFSASAMHSMRHSNGNTQQQQSWADVVQQRQRAVLHDVFASMAPAADPLQEIGVSSDEEPLAQGFHYGSAFPDNDNADTPTTHVASADAQVRLQLNAVATNAQADCISMEQRMEATVAQWKAANDASEAKMRQLSANIEHTNAQVGSLTNRFDDLMSKTQSLQDSVSDMMRRMDAMMSRMDNDTEARASKVSRTDGSSHP